MFYWPRPWELSFRLSVEAAKAGLEIVEASILNVDRCWRGSVGDRYITPSDVWQREEIDQVARERLLEGFDQVEIPEVQMLGNSHLTFRSGVYVFVLLREAALLGYLGHMPFALRRHDAEKFRYYFRSRSVSSVVEAPTCARYKVLGESEVR